MRQWLLRAFAGLVVLGLGVALGAGPLQQSSQQRDRELADQRRAVTRAEARIKALTTSGKYASDFAAATAPRLVAGKLTGRTVGLVLLPGADPTLVAGLRGLLEQAGASVTTEVSLAPSLATSESRQLVEALTSQMVAQSPASGVPDGTAGFQRFGMLLARAVAADQGSGPRGSTYDQVSVGIVSGLQAAGLVTVTRASPRASLTVVVAGPPATSATEAASNAVPVTILGAYGSRTPTLLAGSAAAAGARGVLGALRKDRAASAAVAGVDSIETPMGRVAVVLALAARVQGRIGQYGGVGAPGGPVPKS